jgi:hypothetical protein
MKLILTAALTALTLPLAAAEPQAGRPARSKNSIDVGKAKKTPLRGRVLLIGPA